MGRQTFLLTLSAAAEKSDNIIVFADKKHYIGNIKDKSSG